MTVADQHLDGLQATSRSESIRILAEALSELLEAVDGMLTPTDPGRSPVERWREAAHQLTAAVAAGKGALEVTDPRGAVRAPGPRVWCWACDVQHPAERADKACPSCRTRLMTTPRPAFIAKRVDHGVSGDDRAGYRDGS